MKNAIELVKTRNGCALLEMQPRYDVVLYGRKVGQLYFNLHGYVGNLPTPDGSNLYLSEGSIASFQREAARLNREFRSLQLGQYPIAS